MFARLADFVSRHWLLVLLAWAIIPLAVKLAAPRWNDVAQDGDFAFLPARMTSSRGEAILRRAFSRADGKSDIVLVVARLGGRLTPADFAVAGQLAQQFAPKEGPRTLVASAWSYDDPVVGEKLTSRLGPEGQATLVMLQLRTELMAVENMGFVAQVEKSLDTLRSQPDFPKGLKLGITGSAAVGTDMLLSAEESIRNTEWTTVAMVVLILLVVYRAPGLVIVPLLTIFASLELSTGIIALLARLGQNVDWFDFKVFRTTKIFIVVVLFGAATDYCLFLVSRYREELQHGLTPAEAIKAALAKVGHAVAASAMTTILGLGTMIFAAFGKYRYGGPTIALSLAVSLLACLTLAPALLRCAGKIVFWPFGIGVMHDSDDRSATSIIGRFWQRIAQAIVTHPAAIFIGCLLVLAWPAYQGLHVPITYDLLAELNTHRPSVEGTDLLRHYFPTGESGPITVLVQGQSGVFKSDDGLKLVSRLTKELYDFTYEDSAGVKTKPILIVRSLVSPLGDQPGSYSPFTPAGRRNMAARRNPRIVAAFLSDAPRYDGSVTRLDLITKYDPFSRESVRLLDSVDKRLLAQSQDPASPWHGTEFDFVGTTAGIRDLEAVNDSDYFLIGLLTSLAVLAVLIVVLRRPLLSAYLVATVLLGFFVSIGVTKLVFMTLYGDTFHGLDWKLPLFLFVILVAVGEDYNIYLATRVVEEQRRRGSVEGLRVAVVRTGGIITSCGVIMAGTFASMMTGTLRGMHELGFSLAFGVLLDTFVIRTILVPSFLAIWARWFARDVGSEPPQ